RDRRLRAGIGGVDVVERVVLEKDHEHVLDRLIELLLGRRLLDRRRKERPRSSAAAARGGHGGCEGEDDGGLSLARELAHGRVARAKSGPRSAGEATRRGPGSKRSRFD